MELSTPNYINIDLYKGEDINSIKLGTIIFNNFDFFSLPEFLNCLYKGGFKFAMNVPLSKNQKEYFKFLTKKPL